MFQKMTFLLSVAISFTSFASAFAAEVNVYSSRKDHLIRPLLEAFTEETGIETKLVSDKAGKLIARLKQEGDLTPADVLVTVDAGNLGYAKKENLLQPISSEVLSDRIPAYLRDADNHWFGLSKRARVIFYRKDAVKPEDIKTYEELADPKWRKEVLIRSSSNIYNQSLMTSIISYHGDDEAYEWAKGVVVNMARSPKGGDTDQLRALAAGEGKLAVGNTYYYGRLLASDKPKDKAVTDKIGIIFPNQDDRGAHVNVSGAGVTKHAKNKEEAVRLIEFLSSAKAQRILAEVNYEFPVNKDVEANPVVKSWGAFKEDNLPLTILGDLNSKAVIMMDRAGWK